MFTIYLKEEKMKTIKMSCKVSSGDNIEFTDIDGYGIEIKITDFFAMRRTLGGDLSRVVISRESAASLRDWLNDAIGDNPPLDGMSKQAIVRVSHDGGVTMDGYSLSEETIKYSDKTREESSILTFRKK